MKQFESELIEFFQIAFNNTSHPGKALFGTNSYSISLLTGGVFFAAYTANGSIWLLLDKQFTDIPAAFSRIVKSSKNFDEPLYWLETENLQNLNTLIQRQDIWESYKIATHRIFESKVATAYRDRIARNKILLSDLFSNTITPSFVTEKQLENSLQKDLIKAQKLSQKQRQNQLKKSNPKPERIITSQVAFKRNPYVIIEVLERANGICEKCFKHAPFKRDNGNTPYLEVHHIIPLSDNGDDTVENAIALCPNCHRHAHHGKQTF